MKSRLHLIAGLLIAASTLVPVQAAPGKKDAPAAATVAAQAGPGKLVIHYHRFDGNYNMPGLWTWDARKQKEPASPEVLATGETDYGVYFVVDPAEFGNDNGPEERIGFIPRLARDWNQKDGTDRFWTPDMGSEIWLIGNDPRIYTERPDTSPKIDQAYIDAPNRVSLVLSTPLKASDANPADFTVIDDKERTTPVTGIQLLNPRDGASKLVELQLGGDLDFIDSTVSVTGEEYRGATAALRRVLDDATRFYTDDPMGVTFTKSRGFLGLFQKKRTVFRLFSPTSTGVSLILLDNAVGDAGRTEIPMVRGRNGVWEVTRRGHLEGKHYKYRVSSLRYDPVEINDPNAVNTTGDDGAARITDVRSLDPVGFRPVARPAYGERPTDAIIYQMHIRDFTTLASSGVSEANRGKYLALTETGTTVPGTTTTTGLDHLKELGVTHVQIQPFHDWDNDEDKPEYNWGYMTAFFNSPEGSLSSDIRGTRRIAETKQMIQALKQANMGVILDVVYNHTGVQNTLEASAPGYFLRKRPDGSFWNGSGTGNEFRSEAPMARKFMIDSLKFWVDEYGIDGFRFDLMGLIDLESLQQARAQLKEIYPQILFYGEPWAATGPDGTGIARIVYKDVVKGTGIAAFNDHFRDALKGSPDGNDPGYVVNGGRRDGVIRGIAGSIDDWTANPLESINYADVHDNLILYDKIKYSAPGFSAEERARMQKLSGGILAVSQGIMLIHTGADFLRSKQGNHNSYNATDEINGVRWELKKQNREVFDFYKGVIAIRKAHPMFRLALATEVRQRLRFHDNLVPAPECIVFSIDGTGLDGETWTEGRVLINPTRNALKFALPDGNTYAVYANDGQAGTTPMGQVSGSIEVPAHSMAILGR